MHYIIKCINSILNSNYRCVFNNILDSTKTHIFHIHEMSHNNLSNTPSEHYVFTNLLKKCNLDKDLLTVKFILAHTNPLDMSKIIND